MTTFDVETDADVTRLAAAMSAARQALRHLEAHHDSCLPNALLNLAVARMIAADGARSTAGVLARLADAIGSGASATPERPLDLSVRHS